MRPTREAKPYRLQLALAPEVKERIERLRAMSGADTIVETIRGALAVYDAVLTGQEEGREVVLRRISDGHEATLICIGKGVKR